MSQNICVRFDFSARALNGADILRDMIAVQTALPSPALRRCVRLYAQREVHAFETGAALALEPIPARLEQTLEFQFGVGFKVHHTAGLEFVTPTHAIIGAQTQGCSQIELVPGVISFGAFFRPTGLSRLFGLPMGEATNRGLDAALVAPIVQPLRERLGECSTFAERVQIVNEFLLKMAARIRKTTRMLEVAEFIFSQRGTVNVSRLAHDTGLSVRQFQRRFADETGVSPKRFARVARFQSALDAKIAAPGRAWLDIAHDLRYHDQMHMIRDFQTLGGDTPRQLLAQIGDARPGALPEDSAILIG